MAVTPSHHILPSVAASALLISFAHVLPRHEERSVISISTQMVSAMLRARVSVVGPTMLLQRFSRAPPSPAHISGVLMSEADFQASLRSHMHPFADSRAEAAVQMLVTILGEPAGRKDAGDDFRALAASLRCAAWATR